MRRTLSDRVLVAGGAGEGVRALSDGQGNPGKKQGKGHPKN
jgi:hypothetical protein